MPSRNCAATSISTASKKAAAQAAIRACPRDGAPPVFTDYTYDNLGVPRNMEIPANADPTYFDMGLCGPERTDLENRLDLCGQFKVPTLRNVATRHVIFHNGEFHDLAQGAPVLRAARHQSGRVGIRSTPTACRRNSTTCRRCCTRNVNVTEVPYNRHPGEQARAFRRRNRRRHRVSENAHRRLRPGYRYRRSGA